MLTYFPVMLTYVRTRFGGLQAREEGVTAVEYALMVAIVAVLLVGAFYALFNVAQERYRTVGDCLASGPQPDTCSQEATEP